MGESHRSRRRACLVAAPVSTAVALECGDADVRCPRTHSDPDTGKPVIFRSSLNRRFRTGSRRLSWIGVAVFLLAACGGSGPSGQHASSPSPDQMTQRYVALVHSYWIAY